MGEGRGSLANRGGPLGGGGVGLASCRLWSGGRATAGVRGHRASFPWRSRPGSGGLLRLGAWGATSASRAAGSDEGVAKALAY